MNGVKTYVKSLEVSYGLISDYIKNISKNQVILEIGSLNANDAILLNKYYNRRVYAFEALPKNVKKCYESIKNSNSDVVIIDKAVTEKHNSQITFYEAIGYEGSGSIYASTKNVLE